MSDLKSIKIAGEIFFPRDLTVPNTTFNEDETRMTCTIGKLSGRAVEALADLGVKTKNKSDDRGDFIQSKSKFVFEFEDQEGNAIEAKSIGTGTKVQALVSGYAHKMSKAHGKGARIHKLIVTELVEYNPSMADNGEEAL